jgi:acyl-CoA synthetase (AMP-forming)/AMP-acid ligase II
MLDGNLAALLDLNARTRTRHPAIVTADRTISHGEFAARTRGYAAFLADHGVRPGDVIGVALGDTPVHVMAHFALARLGAIILPIDHRWTAGEQQRVASHFEARLVLAVPGAPSLAGVSSLDGSREPEAIEHGPPPHGDGSTPFALSLSSGTTGRPRGPLLTHSQFAARLLLHWSSLGFTRHDRFLLATPLYFGGGRGFAISMLGVGATVHFHPPPMPIEEIATIVNRDRLTTLFLVPTQLRRLLVLAEGRAGVLFPQVRVLVSSGALLHPHERIAIMEKLTPNMLDYYSSTEGGGISVLAGDEIRERPASVGRPVFGVDVEVVDEAHRRLQAGGIGRVRYRGDGVASGFHRDEEASREAFRDGWFYPGDLGRFDHDGFLTIVGRAKEMIIRGGVNIFPAEIEHALLQHTNVIEAAVVGWPSREFNEEIAAFVVPRGEVTEFEILSYLRQHLAPYKLPKRVFFRPDLPKNAGGKIEKPKLVA